MTNKYIYFTIKQLFIQGVHLGAQLSKNNSNMRRYLLPLKTNNYFAILNLKYSTLYFRLSFNVLQNIISKRGTILVINESEALVPFLKDSWRNLTQPISLGNWSSGTLSNFRYILKKSLKTYFVKSRLADKIKRLSLGNARLPMKLHNKVRAKFNLSVFLSEMRRRIRKLYSLPHAVFVTDTLLSSIAVDEANCVEVPLVGIVDSTNDPLKIAYPIPGNSSSVSTLLFYYKLVKLVILKGILLEKQNFLRKLKFKLLLSLETNLIIKNQSRSNFPVFSKMSAQYVESFFVKNSLYSFFKNLQAYYLFFPHYSYNSKIYNEYTLLLNLFKWVSFKNNFNNSRSQQIFSFGQEDLFNFLSAISNKNTKGDNKLFSSFFIKNADYFCKKISTTFLTTIISQLAAQNLIVKDNKSVLNLNALFHFFKSTNNVLSSNNMELLNKISIFGITLDKKEVSLAKIQAITALFNSNLKDASVFFKFNRRILKFIDLVSVNGKKLGISIFIPKAEANFSFLNSSTILSGLLENKDSIAALNQYYNISNYYFKPEGRIFSPVFPFVELSLLYRNKFTSAWVVNSLFRKYIKPLEFKLSFTGVQFSDIQSISKWLKDKTLIEETSDSMLLSNSLIFFKRLVSSYCFFLPTEALASKVSTLMPHEVIKSLSFFNNFRLYIIPQPVKRVRYFTKYFNKSNNNLNNFAGTAKFTLDFYKPLLQAKDFKFNSSIVKGSLNIDNVSELKNKFSNFNSESFFINSLKEKNLLKFDSSFFKNYNKNNFYYWYGKIV